MSRLVRIPKSTDTELGIAGLEDVLPGGLATWQLDEDAFVAAQQDGQQSVFPSSVVPKSYQHSASSGFRSKDV